MTHPMQAVVDTMRPQIVEEALAILREPPKNAFVAISENEARRVLEAFGLGRHIWAPYGFDRALGAGMRFDRVVVMLPSVLSDEIKDVTQHMRILLKNDGELIFI